MSLKSARAAWLVRSLCLLFILQSFSPLTLAQQPATAAPKPIVDPAHETAGPLPIDTGSTGLQLMLRKLKTTARLMQTVAHPDDEDGAMLAWQSRGQGAEVMLLTLTRGDGGQNKTGSNLFDELGVLRTLELLSSDRYYGVEQRFTRAADFGYTKTAQEALDKWKDHDAVLGDMVRAIREFKPDVIASGWSGTPADGHGHHQAAGILTPLALQAAADPKRFPEQIKEGLQPWQVKRLYVRTRSDDGTMCFEASKVDPVLGRTYAEYGIEGYSHQRSQNAAIFPPRPAPDVRCYKLTWAAPGYEVKAGTKQQDFFEGMDTTLSGLPGDRESLKEVDALISEAATKADASDFHGAANALLRAIHQPNIGNILVRRDRMVDQRISQKLYRAEDAAALALGIELDAVPVEKGLTALVPGQKVQIKVTLHHPAQESLNVRAFWMILPGSFEHYRDISRDLKSSEPSAVFEITVPENAALTRPTWYRADPERDTLHQVSSDYAAIHPLPEFPILAGAQYEIDRITANVSSVSHTAASSNTPLAIVPAFSLLLDHASLVIAQGSTVPQTVHVQVHHNGPEAADAMVKLQVPPGWKVEAAEKPAHFAAREEKTISYTVTPSANQESTAELKATLTANGKTYAEGFSVISRGDLETFYYYQPSLLKISKVNVKVPPRIKVGYIMGAGDDIVPVLEQIGMDVKLLSPDELATGDLSKYGTLVAGIRAYDTREDLRKNNQRLLEYVQKGGTLIVQNNFSVQDFNAGKFTPYPATLSRDRIADENAPVELLQPKDSILRWPNQLTASDFDGWVQERGVNFMSQWDDRFQPLLSSHDPGEAPLKGGLLRAGYGKGTYIYTGYAFFRQLPAGVPGAIRLFVNLLSAGHEPE